MTYTPYKVVNSQHTSYEIITVFSPAYIEGVSERHIFGGVVGLVSTSKVLTPPQSHIKDKSALKGVYKGPLSLKFAGENYSTYQTLTRPILEFNGRNTGTVDCSAS